MIDEEIQIIINDMFYHNVVKRSFGMKEWKDCLLMCRSKSMVSNYILSKWIAVCRSKRLRLTKEKGGKKWMNIITVKSL